MDQYCHYGMSNETFMFPYSTQYTWFRCPIQRRWRITNTANWAKPTAVNPSFMGYCALYVLKTKPRHANHFISSNAADFLIIAVFHTCTSLGASWPGQVFWPFMKGIRRSKAESHQPVDYPRNIDSNADFDVCFNANKTNCWTNTRYVINHGTCVTWVQWLALYFTASKVFDYHCLSVKICKRQSYPRYVFHTYGYDRCT